MTAKEGAVSEVTPKVDRGGQAGNANALRHGLRAVRLNLGSMPAKLKRVERSVNEFRRLIEAATIDAHGEIGVLQAAYIQSACRHETASQLAARWLRLNGDSLDPNQRLAYIKAAADASTNRDKCLERLKLDVKAGDLWGELYGPEALIEAPADTQAEHCSDNPANSKEGTDDAKDGP